jgi:geranylgeranyl reductase family protein
MAKYYYDVIVIGAGPSGATLAYELAKQGIDVLVLEKEKFPRYKCCAGGITHKVLNLLDFDISESIKEIIFDIGFLYRLEKSYPGHYDKPLLYTVTRDVFDNLLVERAQQYGARFLDRQRVIKISINNGVVGVTTQSKTYYSGLIAGADGAYSIVAKELCIKRKIDYLVGIENELRVPDYELGKWGRSVEIEFGRIHGGYAWLFPKHNYLSVGAGCQFSEAKSLRGHYESFIDYLNLSKYIPFRTGSLLIPIIKDKVTCYGERFVLLGDAAGLADPLTGEGIYNAILSAQLCATAIISSLKENKSNLQSYQQSIDRIILPELIIAKKAAVLLTRFPGLVFSLLTRNERIWKNTCKLMRGETNYTTIIKYISDMTGNMMVSDSIKKYLFKSG